MTHCPGLGSYLSPAFPGDSEPPGEAARARTRELGRENRRLQDLATQLQEKHHRISLEVGVRILGRDWNQDRVWISWTPKDLSQVCHLSLCPLDCPQYSELQDKVTSAETKVLEMETTVEDLQWDIEKLRKREQKLNKHLAEALEQVRLRRWVRWSLNRVLGALTSLLHTHVSISSLHSSTLATMCLGVLPASRGARSHSACRR